MKDMNELKIRLGENRRFFAYFHPALEDEPIIFVEIALTKGLAKSIQELTRPNDGKKIMIQLLFIQLVTVKKGFQELHWVIF